MAWDWGQIFSDYVAPAAGAYLESQGSKDAARAETQGYQAGIDEQRRQFDTIMGLQMPQYQVGTQALNSLARLYGYTPYGPQGGSPVQGQPTGISPQGANMLGRIPSGAQNGAISSPKTDPANARRLMQELYAGGFTQEGVNALYAARGLANPPQVPASLLGKPLAPGRAGARYAGGGALDRDARAFMNTFGRQAVDPYRQQSGISQVAGGLLDVASVAFPTLGVLRAGADVANNALGNNDPSGAMPAQPGMGGYGTGMMPIDYGASGPTGLDVFTSSPDYQFRRNEGMRGIENSFAARGGAASGNALRALNEFNSNLASSEFGNYFNRQAALAGIGQTAANQTSSAAQYTGGNIANLLGNQGASRASGVAGQTNAYTNLLGQLSSVYNRNKTGEEDPNPWQSPYPGATPPYRPYPR